MMPLCLLSPLLLVIKVIITIITSIVAGAYKATPIRHLETETYTLPLDLYLNQRLADFEQRLQQ